MLYKAPVDPEQLVDGVRVEDFEADYTAEIWPDNVQAVDVFCAMTTQWRMGPGGRSGLDYPALPTVLRLLGIPRSEWPQLFDDLRVLEVGALIQMNEN